MSSRKIHKILGLCLIIPCLAWIGTGVVFLIKPGYEGAYQKVSVKTYPIDSQYQIIPKQQWHEWRLLKTILGDHLLVNKNGTWLHLNPTNLKPILQPDSKDQIELLQDAVSFNRDRYGTVDSYADESFHTSTGVELSLDWNTLTIHQTGRDTKLIRTLYRIHYLEWFENKQANWILEVLGLLSLLFLVIYGLVLYLHAKTSE